MIYDNTHDNPTYADKFNNLNLNLSLIVLNGFALAGVATTRGFDQLFPYQPSVVKEDRLYSYDSEFEHLLSSSDLFNENLIADELTFDREDNQKFEDEDKNKEIDYTFEFETNNPNVKIVSIALSSFDWKPNVNYLQKVGNTKFELTIKLPKITHYYKYVLDNSNWVIDNTQPTEKDRGGNINNVLKLNPNSNSPDSSTASNQSEFGAVMPDLKLVRREINNIRNLKRESEFFLHQENDAIAIFRVFKEINVSDKFHGYCIISRCPYTKQNNLTSFRVELPGLLSELVFLAKINIKDYDLEKIKKDKYLRGVFGNVNYTNNFNDLKKICSISQK